MSSICEDLEKLHLPHSKLLYYLSHLYKSQEISAAEKTILKEMTIGNEPRLFVILENYEESGCEDDMRAAILALVRQYDERSPQARFDMEITFEDISNELTSPLGTTLFEKKKRFKERQREAELIKGGIRPAV
eukprot:TRINITY_DN22159_c0_g2_i1.p1 TRINITY_DN22159_c0_g2~~TRINITY_DN22159_c0_g2_i1.p1  ORF type:complete len:133 (-),score=23.73 TRINITY_DN22159_c0_g2_i1:157-555(-)